VALASKRKVSVVLPFSGEILQEAVGAIPPCSKGLQALSIHGNIACQIIFFIFPY
jgi:hypothetical protein